MGTWIAHGIIGGVIAGIIFAAFEMIMAAVMMGTEAFFMPLRMIGAIVLGQEALAPAYPLATAAIAGVLVHMLFSAGFGGIFGLIAGSVPALRRSTAMLLGVASAFGLLLWLVNFYVFAPVFGWFWFPEETNAIVQFLAHTFFFGTTLGFYLNTVRGRQTVTA